MASKKFLITNEVLHCLNIKLPDLFEERIAFILEEDKPSELESNEAFKCLICGKIHFELVSLWKSCHLKHLKHPIVTSPVKNPELKVAPITVNATDETDETQPLQPYFCDICGAMYKHKSTLRLHLKRHQSEAELWYASGGTISTKRFLTKSLLYKPRKKSKSQMKKAPNKENAICPDCGDSFSSSHSLKTHQKYQHNRDGRVFACNLCGYTSKSKYNLAFHQNRKHDVVNPDLGRELVTALERSKL